MTALLGQQVAHSHCPKGSREAVSSFETSLFGFTSRHIAAQRVASQVGEVSARHWYVTPGGDRCALRAANMLLIQ